MTATKWDFDLSHSSINFHVRHLMVSKVHGRFGAWSGILELDDQDSSKSRVEVTIDAASIDTKEPKRDAHLRSADFFEVEKFPQLTFKATKVTRRAANEYELAGDLTIRGITRPVTIAVDGGDTVKDPWGGTRTGFSARTSINRKDFGLTWNALLEAGGVTVGDKVEITLEIEAIAKAASAAA